VVYIITTWQKRVKFHRNTLVILDVKISGGWTDTESPRKFIFCLKIEQKRAEIDSLALKVMGQRGNVLVVDCVSYSHIKCYSIE
jgi:hypothetical protein